MLKGLFFDYFPDLTKIIIVVTEENLQSNINYSERHVPESGDGNFLLS